MKKRKQLSLALAWSLALLPVGGYTAFAQVNTTAQTVKPQNINPMQKRMSSFRQEMLSELTDLLVQRYGKEVHFRADRGTSQAAALWRAEDGDVEAFRTFVLENFEPTIDGQRRMYRTLERNLEILNGYFNKIDLALKEPLHLKGPEISSLDMIFGGYSASAHLSDDLYANKAGLIAALNFPYYSLAEKMELGAKWSREEWAFARMGDRFASRIPAEVQQSVLETLTRGDAYISEYNICMGYLQRPDGSTLFPRNMKLITHWGLRDEIKSNYADTKGGLEKQRMIYAIIKRIIDQSIPREVIDKTDFQWDPLSNMLYDPAGTAIRGHAEPDTRYEYFLANFRAMQAQDAYMPHQPNQILRAFEGEMEIPQEDVKQLFETLLSSPQVKKVAQLISKRLGRPLEPFDIWYNGFRSQSGMPESELDKITAAKYPTPEALKADLPNILRKLGFESKDAERIASLVMVDPSRGAGHAAGSMMRNDFARLRTRIADTGMDYKGYNIAIHEFGHNTEQTITMNDVDYYMLNGVPNTSFTEAVAFLFQKRDLELLGVSKPDAQKEYNEALTNFWNCYEIMGVSLVDMAVWEWMYTHPEADAHELKLAVMDAAKTVWNKYYAGILGEKDETILGIYSHMINYPLYLPNYPMGHIIDFQIEQYIKGKSLAVELKRMLVQGRLVPQYWMKQAVGSPISVLPILEAVDDALTKVK